MNEIILNNIQTPYIIGISCYCFLNSFNKILKDYVNEIKPSILFHIIKSFSYIVIHYLGFEFLKSIVLSFQLDFEHIVLLFLFLFFSFKFFPYEKTIIFEDKTSSNNIGEAKIKKLDLNIEQDQDFENNQFQKNENSQIYSSKLMENIIYHEIGHLILFLPLKHLSLKYFVSITSPLNRSISIKNGTLSMGFDNKIYNFINQDVNYRILKGLIDLAGNVSTELFLQQKSIGALSDYEQWEDNLSLVLKTQSFSDDIFYFNDVKNEIHAQHNANIIKKVMLEQETLIKKILKDNKDLVEIFVNLLKEKDKNLDQKFDRILTQEEIDHVLSKKEIIICDEWKRYISHL